LLDNFYLIDDQVKPPDANLPKDYSPETARLAAGSLSWLSSSKRSLRWRLFHNGDGRVDGEDLRLFSYQLIKELRRSFWVSCGAIPIMVAAWQ